MAKVTIADLDAATLPLDGTELYEIEQDGESKKVAGSDLPGGGGASYSVYTALLSQEDTDAPVATVLENTLGGTVVWTRGDVGLYVGTLAAAFVEGKTTLMIANNRGLDASFFITRGNVNTVEVASGDADGTAQDAYMSEVYIEIRVYP